MTTTESNKLIAKFMGAKETGEYLGSKGGYKDTMLYDFTKVETPSNLKFISDCDMKYHASWDWLMPVVEKISGINKMFFHIKISQYSSLVEVWDDKSKEVISEGYNEEPNMLIKSIYEAVIDFIQWHNQSKQQLNN
jgi:hypothetical protein